MPDWLLAVTSLAPLIEKFGVPFVQQLVTMFSVPGDPTLPTKEQWDVLIALTKTTSRQQMLAVLAAHGIDPGSPAGVAFLSLTPV